MVNIYVRGSEAVKGEKGLAPQMCCGLAIFANASSAGPAPPPADGETLSARNRETWPLFNQVSAELIPESKSKVKVQFKEFKILGLIPIKAPPSASGELAVTYLDEDLRISRGNRGNLFVLSMNDRSVKP